MSESFYDFSDKCVSPIKEAASQIFGILSKYVKIEKIFLLFEEINKILSIDNSNTWELSHSLLIILKYFIASNYNNESLKQYLINIINIINNMFIFFFF
jgi:hypothetical protein